MDVIAAAADRGADIKARLSGLVEATRAALPQLERVRLGDVESGDVPGLASVETAIEALRAALK